MIIEITTEFPYLGHQPLPPLRSLLQDQGFVGGCIQSSGILTHHLVPTCRPTSASSRADTADFTTIGLASVESQANVLMNSVRKRKKENHLPLEMIHELFEAQLGLTAIGA